MITTYLTTLRATFNPFSPSSKIPRLFLTLLPANAHKTLQIKSQALPRYSHEPSTLELGFKDGKVQGPGEKVTLQDIVEEVNRHARGLARKEELSG
ncbi:hypothetical protein A1O7_07022 [Cladophialophora yegresii CBS 114405]|uniref:Large ribosomal subunit protein mL53 n=1 Tax=Cladophialophora yegresii CBS 114405 TaxID=1182544 RepID=W9VMC4_9EURO|nr:uncharacterized protein A1O7_07022 [Cladophialophora yegresii CBS 114405]EXJ56678.1 hypothetical protein A1O7_07022 [Cladophialophora yegresii CBS 114405]